LWEAIDAEEEQWEASPPANCGIAAFLNLLAPRSQVHFKMGPIELEVPLWLLYVAFEHCECVQK
jgi:hypothetical protein